MKRPEPRCCVCDVKLKRQDGRKTYGDHWPVDVVKISHLHYWCLRCHDIMLCMGYDAIGRYMAQPLTDLGLHRALAYDPGYIPKLIAAVRERVAA